VQDHLLPTAVYLGGPGEIAYTAQLPPLYRLLDIPQPVIAPRGSFRWIEPAVTGALDALGLAPHEAAERRDALLARLARAGPEHRSREVVERGLLGRTRAELDRFADEARELDPGLAKAIRRTRDTMERAVGKLMDRYARALGQADRETAERLDRVQGALFPEGVPQERFHGLPWLLCRHGKEGLKRGIEGAWRPFTSETVDIRP